LSRRKSASPPAIDLRQVERLAGLSHLSLTRHEAERLREEFAAILEYFATLDGVDVGSAPALQEALPGSGTREDVVGPSFPREVLEGVPQKKGRYVRAPRVF
jgi:aspartyl/glutamyl-tRNA(Asn/Gln) amidotransferase C subunit